MEKISQSPTERYWQRRTLVEKGIVKIPDWENMTENERTKTIDPEYANILENMARIISIKW